MLQKGKPLMASLYRPCFLRYLDGQGRRLTAQQAKDPAGNLLPGVTRQRERSKKWYGKYRDHNGDLKKVPLTTDKEAARALLVERVRQAARRQAGQEDPFEAHRNKDLVCPKCKSMGKRYDRHKRKHLPCEVCGPNVNDDDKNKIPHLSAYRRFLEGKNDGPEHIATTVRRVRAILEGCKFRRLDKISAQRVHDFLTNLRAAGTGVQTSNYYLTAIKGFCQWLVKDRRAGDNPLAHLERLNAETDIRVERRSLSPEEFARLVKAARGSEEMARGLSGPDRAMLYTVAAYTGLRASELASLGPQSLTLQGDPPSIELQAAYSKRKRRDLQPMAHWLAEELAAWLAGKTASKRPATVRLRPSGPRAAPERLWPRTGWYRKAAKILRADLKRARDAWIGDATTPEERTEREASYVLAYRDEAGRVFDFHALRHQYISALAAAGVHPKTAQQRARHSTINPTMNRYTHLAVADIAGDLERLPRMPTVGNEAQAARATGTDGRDSLAVPRAVPLCDISTVSRVTTPPVGSGPGAGNSRGQETRNPLESKGFRDTARCASSVDRAGVEPATPGFSVQCSTN